MSGNIPLTACIHRQHNPTPCPICHTSEKLAKAYNQPQQQRVTLSISARQAYLLDALLFTYQHLFESGSQMRDMIDQVRNALQEKE